MLDPIFLDTIDDPSNMEIVDGKTTTIIIIKKTTTISGKKSKSSQYIKLQNTNKYK